MDLITALILGVVEGITEFLPISSTAHLILTSKLLKLPQSEYLKVFEVVIQSGAILAVISLYLQYILRHKKLWWPIILSFIPTAVIGLIFYEMIKNVFFESTVLIAGSLFVVAMAFLIIENLIKTSRLRSQKNLDQMTSQDAVLVGIGQALAIVPGVSRAGIVMIVAMILGYKREESAIYSFLLAIPTILAAGVLDIFTSYHVVFASPANGFYLMIGFITAYVTAMVSIKWLVEYMKNNTLIPFAIYRIALACVLVIFLYT